MPQSFPTRGRTLLSRPSSPRRRWLLEHAEGTDGTCNWYHYSPGHEGSFREGWCHGPSGSGRALLALAALTGDDAYREAALASTRWILEKGPAPGDEESSTRFYSPSQATAFAARHLISRTPRE